MKTAAEIFKSHVGGVCLTNSEFDHAIEAMEDYAIIFAQQAMLDYGDYIFNQHKGTFSAGDLERAKQNVINNLLKAK